MGLLDLLGGMGKMGGTPLLSQMGVKTAPWFDKFTANIRGEGGQDLLQQLLQPPGSPPASDQGGTASSPGQGQETPTGGLMALIQQYLQQQRR